MKYLKNFNEKYIDCYNLRNICREYLVDLLDMDFLIGIERVATNKINIRIDAQDDMDVHWYEIEDKVIQLISMLNSDYMLQNIIIQYGAKELFTYKISDVISNAINIEEEIQKRMVSSNDSLRWVEISIIH